MTTWGQEGTVPAIVNSQCRAAERQDLVSAALLYEFIIEHERRWLDGHGL